MKCDHDKRKCCGKCLCCCVCPRTCESRMPGTARNNVISCALKTGHDGEHKDGVGIHWR